MERLNELSKQAHASAVKMGFYSENYSNEHYLMLVITEIAEMVEADRENKRANMWIFNDWQENDLSTFTEAFEKFVKNTVEDEMADVAIRLLDLAGWKGADCYLNPFGTYGKYGVINTFDYLTFTEKCYGLAEILLDDTSIDITIQRSLHYLDEMSSSMCINLQEHIELKMTHNETREFKHGKRY